ncbi:hypothetical protein [Lichenicola sp.]|uniref:hypothetical protein n=1 Tax=Lichenicola sp. TaxID=2804529 RepID=UPI003B008A2F
MSQTSPTPNQKVVTELKVSAHLMLLDPGLFCVFHAPGGPLPDPVSGLPGVRITRPPATPPEALTISTFNPDGWLGSDSSAALVRIDQGPAQVLVTIYQSMNSNQEAPKLQVLRLSDAPPVRQVVAQGAGQPQDGGHAVQAPVAGQIVPAANTEAPAPTAKLEVAAHVQRRGDVLSRLGEWMGERGSQSWIEGFAISPTRLVTPADIEYQAVLGKGWLSPWSEGGQYCGSRGMALPILGLRVRLKGQAAEQYDVRVSASFTDGSSIGPVDGSETAEAASLAPLEAFLVEIVPQDDAESLASETAKPPAHAVAAAESEAPAGLRRAARPVAKEEPVQAAAARTGAKPVPVAPAQPARGGPARPAFPGGRPGDKTGSKGRR